MKKFLYIFFIFAVIVACVLPNVILAVSLPRLGIGNPSSGTVEVGGTIRYTVNIYLDPTNIALSPSYVTVHGVTANVRVEGSGNTSRTIVLSNIQGSVGAVGYISIAEGAASNSRGNSKAVPTSTSFTVVATVNNNPPSQPQQPNNNNNNNNGNGNNSELPPVVNNNGGNNTGNNSGNNNNNSNNTNPEEPKKEEDKTNPTMEVGRLSNNQIEIGDEISFEIKYNDDKEMGDITLNENDLTLYGFTADINITGDGNTKKVTLSNIQGNLGGLKYVKIAKDTGKDKAGNTVKDGGKTEMFKVLDRENRNKPDDWIENPNTGK